MFRWVCAGLVAWLTAGGSVASADTCGGTYTVERGDSLSAIADRQYRNAHLWTEIYRANIATIGDEPDLLLIGQTLRLNCIGGRPEGLAQDESAAPEGEKVARAATPPLATLTPVWEGRPITFLTADGYAPFSDRGAPGGGLITEIVSRAMDSVAPETGYEIHWVNDRSAHLTPLLNHALLDMGFPWPKPDCAAEPEAQGCDGFLFSDPLFEALVVLFSRSDAPVAFRGGDSLAGLTLCRPVGFPTHDLDRPDRAWLRDGVVTLVRPETVADCLAMLVSGEVNAVALDEFTGRLAVARAGLQDRVVVAGNRPLSIESLHVVVHAGHPRAADLVNTVNEGLRRIRTDGVYQAVLERHLDRVWAVF